MFAIRQGHRELDQRHGNVDANRTREDECPHTLAVVDEDFLDLEKDVLTATLIGKDAAGKEVRSKTRITRHG